MDPIVTASAAQEVASASAEEAIGAGAAADLIVSASRADQVHAICVRRLLLRMGRSRTVGQGR